MKLAKCSVCGHITDDFVIYGSMFLCDEYPAQCPHICSSACMEEASTKIDTGEWVIPKLKKSHGGYCHDISKPRRGYDAQPSQEVLIKALILAATKT